MTYSRQSAAVVHPALESRRQLLHDYFNGSAARTGGAQDPPCSAALQIRIRARGYLSPRLSVRLEPLLIVAYKKAQV